jgi:hypothetical protein
VTRRTATQHSLLDALLRDLGPALDEINATSLASAEKKLLVRRLIQSRLEHISSAQGDKNAGKAPLRSS